MNKKIKLSQIKNKSEFCWETKSTQNPQFQTQSNTHNFENAGGKSEALKTELKVCNKTWTKIKKPTFIKKETKFGGFTSICEWKP